MKLYDVVKYKIIYCLRYNRIVAKTKYLQNVLTETSAIFCQSHDIHRGILLSTTRCATNPLLYQPNPGDPLVKLLKLCEVQL